MDDEPTRVTKLPEGIPTYGRIGPADPRADPVTQPAMRAPGHDEIDGPTTDPNLRRVPPQAPPDAPTVPTPGHGVPVVKHSRSGGVWTGLILSALVLIVLLVFILQNLESVTIKFLGFAGSLPIGVALLLAAIAGLLLVAIPGGLRILQLRRAARRASAR
jgi:uncharacterized integral membrane protein